MEYGEVKRVLKWMLGISLLLLPLAGGLGLWFTERNGITHLFKKEKVKPVPDLERYKVLEAELKRWRVDLMKEYKKARTAEQKAAVEHDARVILEKIMPEMMRCWRGTGYDFNGVAEKPGEGKIACGYFVSTVIRDCGFKVNRYKLAQQASQNILRTFAESENCTLKVGEQYDSYSKWLESLEPGVYLMGLDTHVGFVVNEPDGMKFIHSSGIGKAGVVEESRDKALAIKWSKWRMLGRFTAEPKTIQMWLSDKQVQVVE